MICVTTDVSVLVKRGPRRLNNRLLLILDIPSASSSPPCSYPYLTCYSLVFGIQYETCIFELHQFSGSQTTSAED